MLPLTLPPLSVKRRRGLMRFDSREAALRYAVRNQPRRPAGCVTVCPPQAKKEDSHWLLMYPVTMPGHVRYLLLGKGGHLLER